MSEWLPFCASKCYMSGMFQGLRIAAVVPAYCEEGFVGKTVASMPSFMDHVIVVDDASADQTLAEARAFGDERLICLRQAVNQGVGAAILRGYWEAFALGADAAVVMAGDGQMDPADLPALLTPIVEGRAEYVKGNRLQHPSVWKDMPKHRLLGTATLAHLTKHAAGLSQLSDSQCGYTAISRVAMEDLFDVGVWPRYGYPNDVLGTLARRGRRIAEVPVRAVYQGERSGLRPWHLLTIGYVIGRVAVRRALKKGCGFDRMRDSHEPFPRALLGLCLLGLPGCSSEPATFTLHTGAITHIEDCHIKMLSAAYQKNPPSLSMIYVCGLPESDLNGFPKDDPRWVTHPNPPLAFTMSTGDCLRLNKTYYCVQSIEPDEALFHASFQKVDGHEPLLKQIR